MRAFFLQILILCAVLLPGSAYSTILIDEAEEQRLIKEQKNGFMGLPFFFYSPETRAAGGLVGIYYYRDNEGLVSDRPSSLKAGFTYTQNDQFMWKLLADNYWNSQSYHSSFDLSTGKYPDKYFGIGNNTRLSDEEEYTLFYTFIKLNIHKIIFNGLYIGMRYEINDFDNTEFETKSRLRQEETGAEGGMVSGPGLSLKWDTRNNIFSPSTGSFHHFCFTVFDKSFGSNFSYNRYTLDLRNYFPFFTSHVLAVQGYMETLSGEPPVNMLSRIGGRNLLRGYYRGRYRDKNIIVLQAEYRVPVYKNISMAGFAGIGDVSDEVTNFRMKDFKYSAGGGFRLLLNRKEGIKMRLDLGFGEDSSGVYLFFLEAF